MVRSRKRSLKRSNGNLKINQYFNRIFIINLQDKTKRFEKVTRQFHKKGIKYTRFEAIDGRCSGKKECLDKKKSLEKKYNVKIKLDNIPASSLVIGAVEIFKQQVKNKWKRILICEDDVELLPSTLKNFDIGIKEVETLVPDYDILYLGCGNNCGTRGISDSKTSRNKYLTSLSIAYSSCDWYVSHKNDLRTLCDDCEKLSKNLSYPYRPGGTWAYAVSLEGAKKILKLFTKNGKITVTDHIDQMIPDEIQSGNLKSVAFDPPIIMHEKGAIRPDTDIPWEW